jgi:hypothetical protein
VLADEPRYIKKLPLSKREVENAGILKIALNPPGQEAPSTGRLMYEVVCMLISKGCVKKSSPSIDLWKSK